MGGGASRALGGMHQARGGGKRPTQAFAPHAPPQAPPTAVEVCCLGFERPWSRLPHLHSAAAPHGQACHYSRPGYIISHFNAPGARRSMRSTPSICSSCSSASPPDGGRGLWFMVRRATVQIAATFSRRQRHRGTHVIIVCLGVIYYDFNAPGVRRSKRSKSSICSPSGPPTAVERLRSSFPQRFLGSKATVAGIEL
jgi:hypothetical protein